jgi:hypothetical protein
MSSSPADKPSRPKLQIQLDDATSKGSYANLALLNHSETEFILDFAFMQPGAHAARVVSRVITTPKHAKRLLRALAHNIDRYEKRHGTIEIDERDVEPPVH